MDWISDECWGEISKTRDIQRARAGTDVLRSCGITWQAREQYGQKLVDIIQRQVLGRYGQKLVVTLHGFATGH